MKTDTHYRFGVSATLACVVGLLLGSVFFAPAKWLAQAVSAASQGRVQLLNARGTVWRGQADVLLTGGVDSMDRRALPGPLSWALKPAWSAGPAMKAQLHAPCCFTAPLTLVVGTSGQGVALSVAEHHSQWPAGLLAGLGTPWNTVQMQGRLALHTPGLSLKWRGGHAALSGELTLELGDAASALSTLRPLGDYRLRLYAPDGALALELRTLRGNLTLTGDGNWTGGRFRFRGLAEAHPDHVDALSNLLNILGRRDGLRAHLSLG